jgi:cytidyltransferase-like protein
VKVILCHGVFDLVHYGHILLFRAARALGDKLIVTLTSDEFIFKGPGRPVFNERQRLDWVKALRSVDEAHIIRSRTGVEAIERFRPAVYAKGRDTLQWTNVIEEERLAIERCGGELHYIDTGTVFHSGDLMSGRYLEPARENQES